jgi:hypothetical protein
MLDAGILWSRAAHTYLDMRPMKWVPSTRRLPSAYAVVVVAMYKHFAARSLTLEYS